MTELVPQRRLPAGMILRGGGALHRHDVAEADREEGVAAGEAEDDDGEVLFNRVEVWRIWREK